MVVILARLCVLILLCAEIESAGNSGAIQPLPTPDKAINETAAKDEVTVTPEPPKINHDKTPITQPPSTNTSTVSPNSTLPNVNTTHSTSTATILPSNVTTTPSKSTPTPSTVTVVTNGTVTTNGTATTNGTVSPPPSKDPVTRSPTTVSPVTVPTVTTSKSTTTTVKPSTKPSTPTAPSEVSDLTSHHTYTGGPDHHIDHDESKEDSKIIHTTPTADKNTEQAASSDHKSKSVATVSGIVTVICISIAAVACVSVFAWKHFFRRRHGNREILINEEDVDFNDEDLRHFEATCIQLEPEA